MNERRLPVAVFCSSVETAPKYKGPAKELGRLLASEGFEMIYGGTDSGLMKVMADAMQENGSRVVGVIVSHMENIGRKNADVMIPVQTLGDRKDVMIHESLAVIGLVGGLGTFDEIAEAMAFSKPVIILNTDGFYDGLKTQLERMNREKFFITPIDSVIQFADTPEQVMDMLWDNLLKPYKYMTHLDDPLTDSVWEEDKSSKGKNI